MCVCVCVPVFDCGAEYVISFYDEMSSLFLLSAQCNHQSNLLLSSIMQKLRTRSSMTISVGGIA